MVLSLNGWPGGCVAKTKQSATPDDLNYQFVCHQVIQSVNHNNNIMREAVSEFKANTAVLTKLVEDKDKELDTFMKYILYLIGVICLLAGVNLLDKIGLI